MRFTAAAATLGATLMVLVGHVSAAPGKDRACRYANDATVDSSDTGVRQCFPSPDGRKLATVMNGRIEVRYGGRTFSVGAMDNGALAWNPASTGFAVADSGGSGETNFFSYVDLSEGAPRRLKILRRSVVRRYIQAFHCAGPNVYVHAWFDGWQDSRRVRLVVQEGVHSEGCRHPDIEETWIGVIGDPATGRIDRVLRQAQAIREWCSAAGRHAFGYCWDGTVQEHPAK